MDSMSPAPQRVTVEQLLQHVPQVTQNEDDCRFELRLGGVLVATLDYRYDTAGGAAVITLVRTALAGDDGAPALVNILVAETLLRLGARDAPVRVVCPLVQRVLDRHPEIPVPVLRETAGAPLSIAG